MSNAGFRFWGGALLLVLIGAVPVAGEPPQVLEHAEYGFRLPIPEGWAEVTGEVPAGGALLAIVLRPRETTAADGQFTLWVLDAADPADAREFARQQVALVKSHPDYGQVEAAERTWRGGKVPVIDFSYQPAGGPHYRARQTILTLGGTRCILQYYGPAAQIEALRPRFEAVIDGCEEIPLDGAGRAAVRRRERAARCGSELDWMPDWEAAAARARAEGKLVLVYVRSLSGFQISDAAMTGAFLDRDVVERVRTSFVAVQIRPDQQTPLHAPERYGMGPATFGQALLVVTPAGQVLREGACFEPSAIYDLLGADEGTLVDPGPIPALDRARILIAHGQLAEAEQALKPETSPVARLLRAQILRRQRRAEEALAELIPARVRAEPALALAIDMERGRIRMGDHQVEAAYLAFDRILEQAPDAPEAREAKYWTGALALLMGHGKQETETCWRTLAEGEIDDVWAWKAAGMLRSTAFFYGYGEKLAWPSEDLLASIRWRERAPGTPEQAGQAAAQAEAWLRRHRSSRGVWSSPSDASLPGGGASEFSEAITALSVRALSHGRDAVATEWVVERAVDWLLSRNSVRRVDQTPALFMDYSVWRHACVLECFVERLGSDAGRRPALTAAAEDIVRALAALQKPNGGWSYFLTTRLQAGAAPASAQSISFVTAAVTLALVRARDAGIALPAGMLDRALTALQRMRLPDGSFSYFLDLDAPTAIPETGGAGAAGRAPACALALFRGGRETVDGLRARLDLLLRHRAALAREGGKALMHTGPEGQGSHYLLFDYALAMEAVAELPADVQPPYRAAILEDALRLRAADGSFEDSPINGRDYGAAMVLRLVHASRPAR